MLITNKEQKMSVFEKNFTVRYSEVDQNNNITLISILKYFQEVGCLHAEMFGMGIEHKYAWVIIQWKVEVLGKVKWNEDIIVKTWPSGITGPYFMRDYEIYKGNELIAIGTSKWVLTDSETHGLIKMTDEIIDMFEIVDKKVFNEPPSKLKTTDEYTELVKHNVGLFDLDTNQHVNNIRYVEIAYEIFNNNTNYVEVMYKHAAVYGDVLHCYNNNGIITMKNKDNISAIIKFKK